MVKVIQFHNSLHRAHATRARQTRVRNKIAAIQGSPYYPYTQDKDSSLLEEAKNFIAHRDRLKNRRGVYEADMFGQVEVPGTPFDKSVDGQITDLYDKMDVRARHVAKVNDFNNQILKLKADLQSGYGSSSTKRKLERYVKAVKAYYGDTSSISPELMLQYESIAPDMAALELQISMLETQGNDVVEDINTTDGLISTRAENLGIGEESNVGPYLGGGLGGGILVLTGLVIWATMVRPKRARKPFRGRKGTAYNVFMGK